MREVEFGDLEAVAVLHREVGWLPPTERGWQRLWADNPALAGLDPPPRRGWVLADDKRVGGFLCNLAQTYRFGDRTLTAAVACAMVVTADCRGESMKLIAAYAQQPHVDLLLNTTAAPQTSKIFEFLKFERIPQADYDLSYYWVLRSARFVTAGLRKKGWSRGFSRLAGAAVGPLLAVEMAVRRRGPRAEPGTHVLSVRDADHVGADFDDLWRRKRAEGPKLLADRSAAALRWHYAAAGRRYPARLVCAHEGSRLCGYVTLVRRDSAHIDLTRAYVADIFVEGDNAALTRWLLAAAARQARSEGAAMLEIVGFPQHIRALVRDGRPFELRNESWPFLYRAKDPRLHETLRDPGLWHASLFDGDGSI